MATQEKLYATQEQGYKIGSGKIMRKLLLAAYALAMPLMVSGCATVPGSPMQKVSVQTRDQSGADVAGASCELKNNTGEWLVTTPGSAIIHRSNDDLQVLCSKGSFAPGRATVVSGTRGAMFGNIILDGGGVATVDYNNGSAYAYPNVIPIVMGSFSKIELPKNQAGQPSNPPSPMITVTSLTHPPVQTSEKKLERSFDSSLTSVTGEEMPGDTAKKVEEYQEAAARGDANAQYMLGLLYATGEGVPKDAFQAIEWYQKSAAQGNAGAQYMLGLVYTTGKGVPKDTVKAAYWYTKAAAQGNAPAQYNLGMAYANSEGVTRDLVRAYAWFDLAAAQGNKDAKKMRDSLAKNIPYAQVAEGQRLASDWKNGDTF